MSQLISLLARLVVLRLAAICGSLQWALGLRALAEEHCDAPKVVGRMLERALA